MTRPVTQSERSIQKGIRNWCINQGFIVIKLTTQSRYGSAGWPDLMLLDSDGWIPLFLEVKTEFGQPSDLQKTRIETLTYKGYPVFIVRSLQQAKDKVEYWRK